MTDFPEYHEVQTLLEAVCEETILPLEIKRLEEIMLQRPEAEAFYVQYMSLNAELTQRQSSSAVQAERALRGRVEEMQSTSKLSAGNFASTVDGSRPRSWLLAVTAMIALLTGVVAGGAIWRPYFIMKTSTNSGNEGLRKNSKSAPGTMMASPVLAHARAGERNVARVTQCLNAVWNPMAPEPALGVPLPDRDLLLISGVAQIDFAGGARLVLEGPAEFELVSAHECTLKRGKLWAVVPVDSTRFKLNTPVLNLMDHGHEFGVKVDTREQMEVHVLRGPVEIAPMPEILLILPQHLLNPGQGLRTHQASREGELFATDCREFVKPDAFEQTSPAVPDALQSWNKDVERLKKDVSLMVHYTFQPEDTSGKELTNQTLLTGPLQNGKIVGCDWTPGRWPGKRAILFERAEDRVKFSLPGEFDNLTLAAWVRIDELNNRFNALMMPDSWDEFEPHWHISQKGGVELGVQGPGRKGWVHYYANGAMTRNLLGQWVHLAVTYDRENGWVTHFVNGYPVVEEAVKLDVPLKIGDAELGNWNTKSRNHIHPNRHFKGAIDQFMIFSRALTMQEIHDLYRSGSVE